MMLAASMANTAMASLHAQHLIADQGRAGQHTGPTAWAAQHSTAQLSRNIQVKGQHSTACKSKLVDMSIVSSTTALMTADAALKPTLKHISLDPSSKAPEYSTAQFFVLD